MSFWIELHCDAQVAGNDPCGRVTCYAQNNAQPGVKVSNAKAARGLTQVRQDARRAGFVFTRERGWVCPACQAALKEGSDVP